MRTTVTLDADTENMLREAMRRTGQSFKSTLNQAVRQGLASILPAVEEPPFSVMPANMGLRAGIDPTRLQQWGDDEEVDAFLDVTRNLSLRVDNPTS